MFVWPSRFLLHCGAPCLVAVEALEDLLGGFFACCSCKGWTACINLTNAYADHAHSDVVVSELGVNFAQLDALYNVAGRTELHAQAEIALESFEQMYSFHQAGLIFFSVCGWVNFLAPSKGASSFRRISTVMLKVYVSWAFSAIFFSTTSTAPGFGADCEGGLGGFLGTILRSSVTATYAFFFAKIPAHVLGVASAMSPMWFWSVALAYFLTCLTIICLFLANVSETDGLNLGGPNMNPHYKELC